MAEAALSPSDLENEQREESQASHSGQESPIQNLQNSRCTPGKSVHGKRAKKIRVFRNGDRFFKGLQYVISSERFRSYDALIEDLNRVLNDKANLPKGVRYIFSVDGKDKITSLEQFVEGGNYICSSTDHFVKLNYLKNEKPNWGLKKKLQERSETDQKIVQSPKQEVGDQSRESREFIRPKLVTILKNGVKPRKFVRILLNKKTAHSFDQVLNDITNVIKLDTGAVRKVYTLKGKQVMSLADFFSDEDIFIAYGSEKPGATDFRFDEEEKKLITQGVKSIGSSRKYVRSSEILGIQGGFTRRRVSSPYVLQDDSVIDSSRGSFSASPLLRSNLRPLSRTGHYFTNGHSYSVPLVPDEVKQKYEIGKMIGDGNFAVVHKCVNKASKAEYALKIIDKSKCKGKEYMIESEVAILRHVRHVNIVQLIEEFDYEKNLYLVMELIKGGDLFDAIASATKFTEKDASVMIYDLSSALCYLHSINIVHRDIKPENLLVFVRENGTRSLKLGDFGLAVEANEPLFTVCGTPTYVAPEILAETGYGVKVDVWAAGVISYILLCGFPPFASPTNDQVELFDQILAGRYEFTAPFWDEISESAKELINWMLQVNPDNRFSAFDVVNHPWIQAENPAAAAAEVHGAVSGDINVHYDHAKLKTALKAAGIALIAVSS